MKKQHSEKSERNEGYTIGKTDLGWFFIAFSDERIQRIAFVEKVRAADVVIIWREVE